MDARSLERPSGPLGAATQSSRPFDPNNNGRLPPPPINIRRPSHPNPNGQRPNGSSNPSSVNSLSLNLQPQPPISSSQVIMLAKEAMKSALEENQSKGVEASAVSNALKPGVTIDLSHRGIQRFPEEVVDIIKNELERLALSHNQISTFPLRFSECTSLRYLNVRNNLIKDFPQCICKLKSLEILDLGRNRLRILPPELSSLTSLKVLSVQKNRIEELPLCLADMSSLQVLKLEGNPIRFPPREILTAPQAMSPPGGVTKENENDVLVTSQIKRYLKQKAFAEAEFTPDEESSEGAETPRPVRRATSGRFPVKVNGSDMQDLRSPALPRPPPIPSRSHARGLSQQTAALRRPSVAPLTMANGNERVRSNSEGFIQATRDRDRSKRAGITNKRQELDTVAEGNSNRYSLHLRGLSHGSAITGSNGPSRSPVFSSPSSPPTEPTPRPIYVRRLSSLPERKRESRSPDPIIEGAKGILYALFQIHPSVQNLLGLIRDGTNKRTSLDRVFYNATTHLEELDRTLQSYINYPEEDEGLAPQSNETVKDACLACIVAYVQVCRLLSKHVEMLIDNGDPRYIRTLLLMVYGSLAEVRNAGASLFNTRMGQRIIARPPTDTSRTDTIRPYARERSITPTRERPNPVASRSRSGTTAQNGASLRVATDVMPPPLLNGNQRSNTMTTASSAATPRSGESFTSLGGSRNGSVNGDFTREDQLFERIFLQLQHCSELGLQLLPVINKHFLTTLKVTLNQGSAGQYKQLWQNLASKSQWALQTAETLKARLSTIKLKEPGIRTQSQFWEICNTFIHAYTDLVMKVKEARSVTQILPIEVIVQLKPLQKSIKDTTHIIQMSPWAHLLVASSHSTTGGQSMFVNSASVSPVPQTPLPMTPQSAALGVAVMATVPNQTNGPINGNMGNGNGYGPGPVNSNGLGSSSGSGGGSGNTNISASTYITNYGNPSGNGGMFAANFFDRADAFLSNAPSRTGTMNSSFSNMDASMTPASLLSPMNSMSSGPRFGASGNVSF